MLSAFLVVRVFQLKKKAILDEIYKHGIFGHAVAYSKLAKISSTVSWRPVSVADGTLDLALGNNWLRGNYWKGNLQVVRMCPYVSKSCAHLSNKILRWHDVASPTNV
jgi:hypothetical protein